MHKRKAHLACLAGLLTALALESPASLLGGNYSRLVAEHRFNTEQIAFTTAGGGPDGDQIYLQSFNLPPGDHTVFITISTQGDTHGGAALWMSARVNGTLCRKQEVLGDASNAPSGWVALQKHFNLSPGGDGGGGSGDMHDNSIYYTWCCQDALKPGGVNQAEIRMATSIPNEPVFIERSHFFIDSVEGERPMCVEAKPVEQKELPAEVKAKVDRHRGHKPPR